MALKLRGGKQKSVGKPKILNVSPPLISPNGAQKKKSDKKKERKKKDGGQIKVEEIKIAEKQDKGRKNKRKTGETSAMGKEEDRKSKQRVDAEKVVGKREKKARLQSYNARPSSEKKKKISNEKEGLKNSTREACIELETPDIALARVGSKKTTKSRGDKKKRREEEEEQKARTDVDTREKETFRKKRTRNKEVEEAGEKAPKKKNYREEKQNDGKYKGDKMGGTQHSDYSRGGIVDREAVGVGDRPPKEKGEKSREMVKNTETLSANAIEQQVEHWKREVNPKQQQPQHQGMGLARQLMHKMGWGGEGCGLGKNESGIAKAVEAKVKTDTLGIGARIESQFAKQAREFKEMEEEAFPSFPFLPIQNGNSRGGPISINTQDRKKIEEALSDGHLKGQTVILSNGKVVGKEGGKVRQSGDDAGEKEEKEEGEQDEGDQGEQDTTSSSSSSATLSPVAVCKDSMVSGRKSGGEEEGPWGGANQPNAPFHRVRADDPEVEEFKRQTGYNYIHKQYQPSKEGKSVGDIGSLKLNSVQGRQFKKNKQKLKDRSSFGAIDVNFRNANRVVFKYDDE